MRWVFWELSPRIEATRLRPTVGSRNQVSCKGTSRFCWGLRRKARVGPQPGPAPQPAARRWEDARDESFSLGLPSRYCRSTPPRRRWVLACRPLIAFARSSSRPLFFRTHETSSLCSLPVPPIISCYYPLHRHSLPRIARLYSCEGTREYRRGFARYRGCLYIFFKFFIIFIFPIFVASFEWNWLLAINIEIAQIDFVFSRNATGKR